MNNVTNGVKVGEQHYKYRSGCGIYVTYTHVPANACKHFGRFLEFVFCFFFHSFFFCRVCGVRAGIDG